MILMASADSKPDGGRMQAAATKKSGKRLKTAIILLAVLLVAAAAAAGWRISNQAAAAPVVGNWYCVDDGMRYTFGADGQFSANIGQLAILAGTWKAGWTRDVLVIDYAKKNESFSQQTGYQFANEQQRADPFGSRRQDPASEPPDWRLSGHNILYPSQDEDTRSAIVIKT